MSRYDEAEQARREEIYAVLRDKALPELAREVGLRPKTLWHRLWTYRWPLRRALETPLMKRDTTVADAARAAGLKPQTVNGRMRCMGLKLEDALYPVGGRGGLTGNQKAVQRALAARPWSTIGDLSKMNLSVGYAAIHTVLLSGTKKGLFIRRGKRGRWRYANK